MSGDDENAQVSVLMPKWMRRELEDIAEQDRRALSNKIVLLLEPACIANRDRRKAEKDARKS